MHTCGAVYIKIGGYAMENNFDGNQSNQVGNYNGGNNKNGVGLGVASMVLGILAILFSCCFYYLSVPLSLVGLILGAVGIKKNNGKGMAIAGLVLSIISLALGIITIAIGGAFLTELGLMDL